jgi:hypothetical protein
MLLQCAEEEEWWYGWLGDAGDPGWFPASHIGRFALVEVDASVLATPGTRGGGEGEGASQPAATSTLVISPATSTPAAGSVGADADTGANTNAAAGAGSAGGNGGSVNYEGAVFFPPLAAMVFFPPLAATSP